MTIDTKVFRRILDEYRQAGVNATLQTMKETVRFGGFNENYIKQCAQDRFDSELKKVQSQ